jgi:hypothetical protein
LAHIAKAALRACSEVRALVSPVPAIPPLRPMARTFTASGSDFPQCGHFMFAVDFPTVLHLGANDAVNVILWKRNPLASLQPFLLVAARAVAVSRNHDARAFFKVSDKIHIGQIKVEMAHRK